VIVRSNGKILMANLAFQEMLGYSGNALAELNVETLTSPEYTQAARGARARQLLDGASYDMRLEAIEKGGARIPVILHSVLLKAWKGEQLRVVTVVSDATTRYPAAKDANSQPMPPRTVRRGIGQMKAVSLAALKASYGDNWPQIASRAMMLAEHTIRHRLGSADVFGRSENEGFVIWFDSSDEARNETVLGRITREIRLRFLHELGADVAARLSSVMVRINVDPADTKRFSAQPVPSPALLQGLNEERRRVIADLAALVRDLRTAPAAEVRPIIDCHGKSKAIELVDFFPTVRRRIFEFSTLGLNLFEQSLDFDLLRLDMAVPELTNRRRSGKVLLPISWPISRPMMNSWIMPAATAAPAIMPVAPA
jgi:PAS domain S-box-containing protein